MTRRLSALALLLLLAAPGAPSASAAPPVVFDYADRGYVYLDPARCSARANDERIILGVFECLTRLDAATGKVAPAAAERWEPAADGRSWTFTLRADGAWSDGTRVKAADFVRGWRRVLDPIPDDDGLSPWRPLFRPIQGVPTLLDNDFGRRVLGNFERGLSERLDRNKEGIPGNQLRELVAEVGLKAVPGVPEQPDLRRMLRWGEDRFSAEQAQKVLDVVKTERRKRKAPTFDTYDAFGVKLGAIAKDDRTLVVETVGWVPGLPALLARGPFAPFPEKMVEIKVVGEDPDNFVGNGPFVLHRRGAKRSGEKSAPPSTVHLVKSPTYKGPSPAKVDEIRCWTDEDPAEELRRFKGGETQWIATPDPESKKVVEALPGFRTRPTGTVLFLRFRCDTPPFEKAEARRAFAWAIDRAALAKRLWPVAAPADRLLPPTISGLGTGALAPTGDTSAAKQALAANGISVEKFPYVTLRYTEGHDSAADHIIKIWDKVLGITAGALIDTPQEALLTLRSGMFEAFLSDGQGAYDDPAAFLEGFESSSPDAGLGWRDPAFDAFIAAARDVDAAAAAPEKLLGFAKRTETKSRLAALKASPSPAARDALRQALFLEAEQRLLDEVVVFPLLFPKTCDLLGAVKGLGEPAAWANCAFVGSLRDATR
jgi:ABC-type oligopeptide transport system substrate-binding subunit